MKTFRIFSIAVLGIILAACSSNDEIIEQPAQPNDDVIHFSGTISLEGAGTRTAMTETEADKTITVDWQVNDVINLCQSDTKYGTAQVKSLSGTSAYIEGTLSGSGYNLSNDFDLIYLGNLEGTSLSDLSAIYPNQKGTVADLGEYDCRKGCAKLKLESGKYVIDGTVKLEAQMAIWKLTLTYGTSPLNMDQTVDQLKVYYDGAIVAGAGTNFSGGSTNVVYLAVPTASSKTIKIEYTNGTITYVYQKSGVSIAASKYYQSTVTFLTLASLKSMINSGIDCSAYIGYQVNSDGVIAASGVSGTLIGYIGYISTTDVDTGVSGSRILVVASSDDNWGEWGSKGISRGLTTDGPTGYSFTNTLQAYGNSPSTGHPAAYNAWNHSAAIPIGGATPAHWFLPTQNQLNSIITAVGGFSQMTKIGWYYDHHWTSTEYNADYAVRIDNAGKFPDAYYKESYCLVRACFAY